jgi:ubiquitin C-terminal hydrolase
LRALHPNISPLVHRLGVTYHQPKKHKSDSKYTIAPREFLGTFNAVYPSFRKGESQEDAMEFFSKVRERLHDELRADLELRIRTAGKEIESDEQWIMGTSPISDIFRGYYITKVHPPQTKLTLANVYSL